jgi:glycolate oxidase iron-sulfur subunit
MIALSQIIQELSELEELIVQCSRCGTCQSVCPLYRKDWRESSVARGKVYLLESLVEGRLNDADRSFEYLDYCLLCGRCKRDCPSGVQTDQIFLKAKSILRQVHKLPSWQRLILKTAMNRPKLLAMMSPLTHLGLRMATRQVDDGIFKPHSIYRPIIGNMTNRHIVDMPAKALTSKYGGLNQADQETMRVIFYPGCASTLIYAVWGEAIIETLKHFGVSVYVPEVNHCCGIPAATMGDLQTYSDQVAKNFDYFDSIHDADTIITCCPTCEYGLGALGEAETGRQRGKTMMDVVLFLAEVLQITLSKKIRLDGSSTLHIPCHYNHEKDEVLRQFIVDNFETDYQDLENQSCCGFGGTFSIKNYAHTQQIGKLKADEIKAKNHQHLFTACPGCAMNLTDANYAAGLQVKATHPVVEIYEQVVKPQLGLAPTSQTCGPS